MSTTTQRRVLPFAEAAAAHNVRPESLHRLLIEVGYNVSINGPISLPVLARLLAYGDNAERLREIDAGR